MEKENTSPELFLSGYKFFQKEWQIKFDKTYPDLQLNGKSYNTYVKNFIKNTVDEAINNFGKKDSL